MRVLQAMKKGGLQMGPTKQGLWCKVTLRKQELGALNTYLTT